LKWIKQVTKTRTGIVPNSCRTLMKGSYQLQMLTAVR